MRQRPNQKCRRKPHREAGIFSKNGILRVVELHPTKGFREQNGEEWRADFKQAMETNQPIKLSRGKTMSVVTPVAVRSNVPTVRHNKTG